MSAMFDFEFVAEIHLQKKDGDHFKIEKGFHDLQSAKKWIRKKICATSGRWYIESWGNLVLEGE